MTAAEYRAAIAAGKLKLKKDIIMKDFKGKITVYIQHEPMEFKFESKDEFIRLAKTIIPDEDRKIQVDAAMIDTLNGKVDYITPVLMFPDQFRHWPGVIFDTYVNPQP